MAVEAQKFFSKRKIKYIILIILFLVLATGLYSSDRFMFDFLDTVHLKANKQLPIPFARKRLFSLVEEMNIFNVNNKAQKADLLEIQIGLSPQDVSYFEEAVRTAIENFRGVLPEGTDNKRDVDILYDGVLTEASMSLHGDILPHYGYYKKSFNLEFKGEIIPEDFIKWRLLILEDRGYLSPFIANYVNELLSMPVIENKFAKVYINDKFFGVYYLEEKYDETYLAKNGLVDHVIIKFDNKRLKRGDYSGIADNAVDLIAQLDKIETKNDNEVKKVLNDFLLTLEDYQPDKLKGYLDIDRLAAFEAWRLILGKTHDVYGLNMRLAYDLVNHKFFIVPRLESNIHKLVAEGDKDDQIFDVSVSNNFLNDGLNKFMSEDEGFKQLRDKYLKIILDNKEEIKEYYQQLEDKYLEDILFDTTMREDARTKAHKIEKDLEYLEYNLSRWKNEIDYVEIE